MKTAASPASATCCHGTRRPTGSARNAGKSPRGRAPTASSNSRRLTSWTGWPISCRRRGSTASLPRGVRPESQAQAHRHGTRHRERRQAARRHDRRTCSRRADDRRRLRLKVSPVRGPPTDWGEFVQTYDDRAIFQASPDFSSRDRHPQPVTEFHATVRTAREQSGFKAGLRRRRRCRIHRPRPAPYSTRGRHSRAST